MKKLMLLLALLMLGACASWQPQGQPPPPPGYGGPPPIASQVSPEARERVIRNTQIPAGLPAKAKCSWIYNQYAAAGNSGNNSYYNPYYGPPPGGLREGADSSLTCGGSGGT